MLIIEKHRAFVKDQIAFQEKMARRYATEPWRRDLHLFNVAKFLEILDDMESMQAELTLRIEEQAKATPTVKSMTLTPDDLEGLPDEVLQELSISDSDKQEFAIVGIISESGGILSLDKIIVGLFRKSREAVKRTSLTSRLYRMVQKGLIFNVPTKKGFYSTRLLNEQDVRRIFGADESEESERETQQSS